MDINLDNYVRPGTGILSAIFGNPHRIESKQLSENYAWTKVVALERRDGNWDVVKKADTFFTDLNGNTVRTRPGVDLLQESVSHDIAMQSVGDFNKQVDAQKMAKSAEMKTFDL